MVHRRSITKLAEDFVLTLSFRDKIMAETVCTVERSQIIKHLTNNGVDDYQARLATSMDLVKGLVLRTSSGVFSFEDGEWYDSRGRGGFQA